MRNVGTRAVLTTAAAVFSAAVTVMQPTIAGAQQARTIIDADTTLQVRTNDAIDVKAADGLIYKGTIDQDVLDRDGLVAIPEGSSSTRTRRVAHPRSIPTPLSRSGTSATTAARTHSPSCRPRCSSASTTECPSSATPRSAAATAASRASMRLLAPRGSHEGHRARLRPQARPRGTPLVGCPGHLRAPLEVPAAAPLSLGKEVLTGFSRATSRCSSCSSLRQEPSRLFIGGRQEGQPTASGARAAVRSCQFGGPP